ncbi:MAG: patatin-like phospholipase family protein, partial [Candidatus Syntrophosphaera sp.]
MSERERKNLALNLSYTTEEELNVGAVLSVNNLILKNSRLLAGFTLGGRTELNFDFVKNFGELWGAYFRIYPWLSENRLYVYDEEHYKTDSVKALEFGVVPGVGVFARKLAITEAFAYSYRTRLYRDVSDTAPVDSLYLISGVGVKTYHESLDDDIFPTSGIRAFAKANFARWDKVSDQIYSRFVSELDVYSPLMDFASLRLGFDYGTYFGDEEGSSADPFYFCGSNGYRGYQRYEVSSSQYKIYTLGMIFNPLKNLYLEAGFQGLNIGSEDTWDLINDTEWAMYADLGYRTMVGPIKFIAAAREEG